MLLAAGQNIRFVTNDRGGAWRKGSFGSISRVLSHKPLAQDDIYLVDAKHRVVWATGSDVERWDQLSLLDSLV